MKKLFALLLVAVMCFSLVACGGGNDTPTTNNNNEQQTNESGSQQETDISTMSGTWKCVEEGTQHEFYLVFDGNGNLTVYQYTEFGNKVWGTFKYEYNEYFRKAVYWSTEEEGAFCDFQIVNENGDIQYRMQGMRCELVENFVPDITE